MPETKTLPQRFAGLAIAPILRAILCIALLGGLAACSGSQGSKQEAADYRGRARGNYTPPGPPSDPWGPYILEASARFDVPERWIREVIRVESGGRLYENGQLITSGPGAMGLMQVMPGTYDGLRARYELGDDPYDPHDNIMAGTAYIRQMYEVYGSPGFLAAYNAGPGRLEDYLYRRKPLPDETRRYVAKIAPNIAGIDPQKPSGASQLAMYQLPANIPPGPRNPRTPPSQAPVALADTRSTRSYANQGSVIASNLPSPPPSPPVQMAAAQAPKGGFRLIAPAMADTLPRTTSASGSPGGWAIQVGAYANEAQARAAADSAKTQVRDLLGSARVAIGTVKINNNTLYRARLAGISRDTAVQACDKVARSKSGCIVISPDAQS